MWIGVCLAVWRPRSWARLNQLFNSLYTINKKLIYFFHSFSFSIPASRFFMTFNFFLPTVLRKIFANWLIADCWTSFNVTSSAEKWLSCTNTVMRTGTLNGRAIVPRCWRIQRTEEWDEWQTQDYPHPSIGPFHCRPLNWHQRKKTTGHKTDNEKAINDSIIKFMFRNYDRWMDGWIELAKNSSRFVSSSWTQ